MMNKSVKSVFVVLVFVAALIGCDGCKKSVTKKSSAPIPKGTIYGNVTEFPGPFTDTTDITYYDLEVNYDYQNGQVGIACLKAPNTAGDRLPALYVSSTDVPNWREVGVNFFAQHANARGMLLGLSIYNTMLCVIHHNTTPSTSSIYKTLDGGQTWSDVVLNIPGVVTHINEGTGLYYYSGMDGTKPFQERVDKKTVTVSLPIVPVSPQHSMSRDGQNVYGAMDGALFGLQYAGPVTVWAALLPQTTLTLPANEEVLSVYGIYGATHQSSAPAVMLGRYGYRTLGGYTRYPSTISQPVSEAWGHKYQSWLLDAANEVWTARSDYRNSVGSSAWNWERIYGGVYPSFYADGKANSGHFANGGPTPTTWIVSEGTMLLVHKWEY